MLQIHFDVDPADRRHVGMLLAAFNAIADFLMHSGASAEGMGMPMQGPATTAQPGAPAPTAPKPRKPRGGAAQPPQAEQPGLPFQAMQQPGAMQPPPPNSGFGSLGEIQGPPPPDIKTALHTSLRDFATNYGPMALQGLLAYFGVSKTSELQLARAGEIMEYIRAAQAQAQAQAGGQLG